MAVQARSCAEGTLSSLSPPAEHNSQATCCVQHGDSTTPSRRQSYPGGIELGALGGRHKPQRPTAKRNPSPPFLRRKDKSPAQPDPRKPTPSGLDFQTCALSSGLGSGALLYNFFDGLLGTKQKKSSLEYPKLLLLTRFSIFLLPGGPLSKLLVATISLPRLGFSSSRDPLLLLPKLGSGRSRSQTADPARPGTSQTRSPQMPWRSHGSPGQCHEGSHAR